MNESTERLAYSPEEAAQALGIGRATFYQQLLLTHRVRSVKIGRRRLIPVYEIQRLLDDADFG